MFVIVPTRKQHKCPAIGEWMSRLVPPLNGILLRNEKEWTDPARTWIDLKEIILSEKSQTKKSTLI